MKAVTSVVVKIYHEKGGVMLPEEGDGGVMLLVSEGGVMLLSR